MRKSPVDGTWLREQYVDKKRTGQDIADECGVAFQTVFKWLHKYNIPVRSHSEANMGKPSWNKGIPWSDEMRKNVMLSRMGMVHPATIRAGKNHWCYGKKRSAAFVAALSERMKGERNPMYGKTGNAHPSYGRHFDEEVRAKMSAAHRDVSGKNNPQYGKESAHGRGAWYTQQDGTEIWLRSSYEVRVANALSCLGIAWDYEPKSFELSTIEKTYRPDFLIDGEMWWEVKGWMRPKDGLKIQKFFELYPNEDLKVVRLPDILKLEQYAQNNTPFDIKSIGNTDI